MVGQAGGIGMKHKIVIDIKGEFTNKELDGFLDDLNECLEGYQSALYKNKITYEITGEWLMNNFKEGFWLGWCLGFITAALGTILMNALRWLN